VNPHLNNATKKDKLDGLLYDWGIHHLYLGETFSALVCKAYRVCAFRYFS